MLKKLHQLWLLVFANLPPSIRSSLLQPAATGRTGVQSDSRQPDIRIVLMLAPLFPIPLLRLLPVTALFVERQAASGNGRGGENGCTNACVVILMGGLRIGRHGI